MKTYNKSIYRSLRSNLSRFFSITSIILVGICFVTGVGGITSKIEKSFSENLNNYNASDFIIKSKNPLGFNEDELDKINKLEDIKYSSLIFTIDSDELRIYSYSFSQNQINKLKLISGAFPVKSNQLVVEQSSKTLIEHYIGEKIDILNTPYEIVGIVENPIMFYKDGDQSMVTDKPLKTIVYIDSDLTNFELPKTDILIKLDSTFNKNLFSNSYNDIINDKKDELDNIYNSNDYSILTQYENKSFAILDNICKKIDIIALIFPLFFTFVVALVVLTTISRLVDEERQIIGCYKSLGYSNNKILFKYLFFSLTCLALGISLGLITGALILPNLIYPAFDMMFFLPKITNSLEFSIGIFTSLLMFIGIIAITLIETYRDLNDKPTRLLTYRAPKAGRKIFLERIKFIWKKLSFKYKSSFRNIFRYKGRLLMIVVSMCGCSALVLAGFGLKDVSNGKLEFKGLVVETGNTITIIAVAIIAFALLLSVLVLYNLTNMNIGERKRELATLKVLGYTDKEVNLYIFREILIMSLIGIIMGIPAGIGLLYMIFNMLEFGSIDKIKIISYFFTIGVLLLFILVVDILLSKKINKIDMNDALKTLE